MKALILAAGMGTRIKKYSKNKPKCLLEFDGYTILDYQLKALEEIGICKKNIIIVTGYKSSYIKETAGDKITYIHNPEFASTNSIYSMWLARNEIYGNDLFLINADVIFHKKILKKMSYINGNAIAIDSNKKLVDGEMNVIIKDNIILKISKQIHAQEANGESVQIVKLDKEGAKILFDECEKLISKNIKDKFPAYIFQYIINQTKIQAVDIGQLPWVEIDYPKDYDKAKKIVWEK